MKRDRSVGGNEVPSGLAEKQLFETSNAGVVGLRLQHRTIFDSLCRVSLCRVPESCNVRASGVSSSWRNDSHKKAITEMMRFVVLFHGLTWWCLGDVVVQGSRFTATSSTTRNQRFKLGLNEHSFHHHHLSQASRGLFRLQEVVKGREQQLDDDEDIIAFMDMVRDRVAEQAPDLVIRNEDIVGLFLPAGAVERRSSLFERDDHEWDMLQQQQQHYDDAFQYRGDGDVNWGRSNETQIVPWNSERQLDQEEECQGEVLEVIVGVAATALCAILPALCSVGKKVGRKVVKKLRSAGKTKILKFIKTLTNKPTGEEAADAVFAMFKIIVKKIGVSALMDSVGSSIVWYEWILIAINLVAEILLLIIPGAYTAALLLRMAAVLTSAALLVIDIQEAVEACDGVDRINCGLLSGYDFYENENSFDFSLPFAYPDDGFGTNGRRCSENYGSLCKGFNSDGWFKYNIQPYDEWVRYGSNNNCRGLFIKEGIDICRRSIPGYVFYEDYDSPGNDITNMGGSTLLEMAEDCDNRAGLCQGFNTNGWLKFQINSVDMWGDVEATCGGTFVKKEVDVCPKASGYQFFRGFNSPGSTDHVDFNTIADVANTCDARGGGCQGFNSTGTLKAMIAPFVDWVPIFSVVCVGLFVPNAFVPECVIDGYQFFENKDSPGNDLEQFRGKTLRELATICDGNNRCDGFNSLGILKHLVKSENSFTNPKALAGFCQGIYVKNAALAPARHFCRNSPTTITISNKETSDFGCSGTPNGKTKLAWVTTAVSDYGFEDDEYYIHIYQQNNNLYESIEQFWDTPGMSDASDIVGVPGVAGYRVQFRCNNFFWPCEGGRFEFVLVDCGCPDGVEPVLVCRADQIAHSRNAVCPGTPSPTHPPSLLPSTIPSAFPTFDFDPPGALCSIGPDPIFLDHDSNRTYACDRTPRGEVKIAWRTKGVSSEGFGDDEYFVKLFQGSQQLYASAKQDNKYESSGSSGSARLGIAGAEVSVVFQCDLSWPFSDCEGGNFEFKVVDCGCPGGETPLIGCTVASFERARNAVCSPTPAPTLVPTLAPIPRFCFSGVSTVVLEGQGPTSIAEIVVGDRIQVSEKGEFDTVYSLMKANHHSESEFFQLHVEGQPVALELTGHHLLVVNNRWRQASKVVIGDTVITNKGPANVTRVATVRRHGFFAPLTYAGVIMASGVKSSVFAGPETLHFASYWETGLPLHDVLHQLLGYHRLLCRINFDTCRHETHTDSGTSLLFYIPDRVYQWWVRQSVAVGYIALVPLLILAAFAGLAELAIVQGASLTPVPIVAVGSSFAAFVFFAFLRKGMK